MDWGISNKYLVDRDGGAPFGERIRSGASKKACMKILCLSTVVLSGLLSGGCGDDNPAGAGGSIPAALIATWTYESVTINGEAAQLADVLEWKPETVTARFTLSGNATFVQEELDADGAVVLMQQGSFSTNLNRFTITVTSDSYGPVYPPIVISGTGVLDGNKLTMTIVEEGDTLVIVATK